MTQGYYSSKIIRWYAQALEYCWREIHGVVVIGEVSDGLTAVKLSKELDPDVVLMDIAMPGMNGLEATRRIRQECERTKVLMLSMYTNEEYLKEALRAGASGYLLKDADRLELELAIQTVWRGEPISRRAWRNLPSMPIAEKARPGPVPWHA